MEKMIKYLKVLAIPFISIIILSIFLTLGNIFGIKTNNILILVIMVIVMFISGIIIGNKSYKKSYLNGLLIGIYTSLLLVILSLLFGSGIKITSLLYYLILILSSMFGAMFTKVKK